MKRKLLNNLIEWKNDKNHKPLVLEGARQVGKTWLMKEFGRTQYKKVAYINFDRNEKMCKVFETDLDTNRLVTAVELDVEFKITPENTLIIFDEIQECPRAITSLKYFNEDAPQYDIIAAGSLLGVAHHFGTGFPVGKVEFLRLYPLSFTEFLDAMGKEQFVELIEKQDFEMIKLFNTKFEDLLKQYTYIGGMPEVVQDFVDNKDFKKVRTIQKRILSSYEKDFSKHIPANTVEKVRMLWNSVPTQLAKDNKKFIYNAVKKGARAKEFETALTWLKDAGLIYQVYKITKPGLPIGAYEDLDSFKLFVLDVGLLGALVNLDAKTILDRYEIFQEFKGAMAEQYVLQQFKTIKDLPVYYWTNETSRSEVDFVIQLDSKAVPVEVKAATNLKARSLKIYIEQFKPKLSLRTSLADYKKTDNLVDLPLYTVETIKEEL
ncbi:MAG: ATP-binding protein [Candidatus Gastranaerophilales bacterium]|nr:ATP-binding protein [Candidatus Gastranaerophilales bacterium]